jgi:hypothetical protein
MVGGRDYATRPFNLATQGQRQPGSSIKPFILAQALKKGYVAGSLWPSRKRVFTVPGTRGKEKFVVNNFESKYAGTQTLAGGLTYSDNSVFSAVGISVGTKKIAALAERMGIRTPVSSNYAMTLGGLKQGVTPLDMAHAYETFIEGGRRIGGTLGAGDDGPVGIQKVISPNGKTLKTNHITSKSVLDRAIANETVGIMTTVISQGTGAPRRAGPGPVRGRQDGDDREQRRRVVRRLHQALDRRGLGRLPGQAQADAHRVRRGPGRRRHLPGPHLARLHGRRQRHRRRPQRQGPGEEGPAAQAAGRPDDHHHAGTGHPDQAGARARGRRRRPGGSADTDRAPVELDRDEHRHGQRRQRRDEHRHDDDQAAGPDHHHAARGRRHRGREPRRRHERTVGSAPLRRRPRATARARDT